MADRAFAGVLRARFAAQRLSDGARLGADAAAVARAVCAVQSQELNAGMLSLRARSNGLTREALLAAFDAKSSLAWTWLMRGTLHVCAADDLRWLLSLFGPLNAARDATRRSQVGLDDATCARAVREIRSCLADGPLTRSDLREQLLRRGVDVLRDPQTLIHVIAYAASQGVLVVLPPRGRDNRFGLLDDWISASPALTRDAAEAELARRYFTAFGPATVADFRTWSGVPMPTARRATSLIGGELEETDEPLPGLLRVRRRSDHPAAPERVPTARLLPRWDTYVLGYRSRELMLHSEQAPRVCVDGVIKPTLCVDGAIDGAWELRRAKAAWRLEIMPFKKLSSAARAGVLAESDAIERFLGAPVESVEFANGI